VGNASIGNPATIKLDTFPGEEFASPLPNTHFIPILVSTPKSKVKSLRLTNL
jgi:hypothetical protein